MKEIRLCDDGKLDFTSEICKKNNIGIEIQGFYNPYIDNKEEVLEKYKKLSESFFLRLNKKDVLI